MKTGRHRGRKKTEEHKMGGTPHTRCWFYLTLLIQPLFYDVSPLIPCFSLFFLICTDSLKPDSFKCTLHFFRLGLAEDGGEEATYKSISSRPSTILLTFDSDITIACLTSNSFIFARIWKSKEWRLLRQRTSASQVFSPPTCRRSSLALHMPSPSTAPGSPVPCPRSLCLPRWASQPFRWGQPWLTAKLSSHLLNWWVGDGKTERTNLRTFCCQDDNCCCDWAPCCFGGLPLPMSSLCQAAAQLGRLASGTSHASLICAFGCDVRPLAGVAGAFSANQSNHWCQDFALDGGGLGHHALLILFLNPLVAH